MVIGCTRLAAPCPALLAAAALVVSTFAGGALAAQSEDGAPATGVKAAPAPVVVLLVDRGGSPIPSR